MAFTEEYWMDGVHHGDKVFGGPITSGSCFSCLDEAVEALQDAVINWFDVPSHNLFPVLLNRLSGFNYQL